VKRLFIAIAAAAPVVLAGAIATAQGEGAAARTATAPSKLTICHKTGSDEWRRLTVSSRAMTNPQSKSGKLLRAHLRHVGDAVVAGTGPCPSAQVTPAPAGTAAAKLTICHKTGSAANPYRRITISGRAVTNPSSESGKLLRGHMRHTGDIVMPGVTPCPPGTSQTQGVKLRATLAPVSGATGSGTASITIRLGGNTLCATLTVTGLTNVTAAHIHLASTDGVVVPLTAPTSGTATGCTTVDSALLRSLVRTPGNYYVNVHTTAYPNGHVQGTLTR
jgi:CHRD domain